MHQILEAISTHFEGTLRAKHIIQEHMDPLGLGPALEAEREASPQQHSPWA